MRLRLQTRSTPDYTMGFLEFGEYVEGFPGLYTIEPPWKGNIPYVSCVPAGFYRLVQTTSGKYQGHFALVGDSVSASSAGGMRRSACVFHAANWAWQLQGCIGPGMAAGMAKHESRDHAQPMVSNSRPALEMFHRRLLSKPGDEHYLTIERDVLTHG